MSNSNNNQSWLYALLNQGGLGTLTKDVSVTGTQATVEGIQGVPVDGTQPTVPSIKQFDGASYKNVGAPIPTYWGKNSLATDFAVCVDDAPDIQAILNSFALTGGQLNVMNAVLKTPLDFSGIIGNAGGGSGTKINFGPNLRYAANKAELNIEANGITIDGHLGGYQQSWGGGDSQCYAYAYSSSDSVSPELNSQTTNGIVDGPFMYYKIAISQNLPASAIGQVMVTSSVTDPHWNGNWRVINAMKGYAGLIWLGSGTTPIAWNTLGSAAPLTTGVSDIVWSIASPAFSGTGAQAYSSDSIGGKAVLRVRNAKLNQGGATFDQVWKHYLRLHNCSNEILNTTVLRLFGAESNTTCYVNGTVVCGALNGSFSLGVHPTPPVLPDYGIKGNMAGAPALTFAASGHTITRATGSWITDGFVTGDTVLVANSTSNNGNLGTCTVTSATVLTFGSGIVNESDLAGSVTVTSSLSSAPACLTYEKYPACRVWGSGCNVNNIVFANVQGDGLVLDGFTSPIPINFTSKNFGAVCGPGGVPLIIDGSWEWVIKDVNNLFCSVEAHGPNLVTLLTSNCAEFQQGTYLGRLERFVTGQGGVKFQAVSGNVTGIVFDNWVLENSGAAGVLPAVFMFDTTNGQTYRDFKFRSVFPADTTAPYILEATSPAAFKQVQGLFFDHELDYTGIGPNLIQGAPDLVTFGSDAALGSGQNDRPLTRNLSAIIGGYSDLALIGDSTFAPVMTLPYQVPIPPLNTPADWNALSPTNLDFATATGPDFSPNSAITLHATSAGQGYVVIASTTVASPAIGDVVMVRMRMRVHSPSTFQFLAGQGHGPHVLCSNTTTRFDNNQSASYDLTATDDTVTFRGGAWTTSAVMGKVTTTDGTTCTLNLYMVAYNAAGYPNYDIDPSSLAFLYIPASAGLSDAELIRIHRKVREQINGATPGNVALPDHVGISFGERGEVIEKKLFTQATSPATIYSYAIPVGCSVVLSGEWDAHVTASIGSGYVSAGRFLLSSYNNGSAAVVNGAVVNDGLINCGVAGAAIATSPIIAAASGGTVSVQVQPQASGTTVWGAKVRRTMVRSVSTSGVISSVAGTVLSAWNGIGAAGGDVVTITGTGFISGASLAFAVNGVAFTSVVFVNSTTCTAIASAQTGVASPSSAFTITGVNGDGAPMASGTITYQWDLSQLPSIIWLSRADQHVTVTSSYVSAWGAMAGAESAAGPLAQATATHRPALVSSWTNSRPALSNINNSPQSDTNVMLLSSAFGSSYSPPYTCIVVGQWNNSFGNGSPEILGSTSPTIETGIYTGGLDMNAGLEITSASHTFTVPMWITAEYNTTSSAGYLKASSIVTGSTGTNQMKNLSIFGISSGSYGFGGYIGEVAVCANALDATHLGYVATYMGAFWGIS